MNKSILMITFLLTALQCSAISVKKVIIEVYSDFTIECVIAKSPESYEKSKFPSKEKIIINDKKLVKKLVR